MNSKIYRCGWCGYPTDENGRNFNPNSEAFAKADRIIKTYGDGIHTHKVNGECCPNGNY